MEIDLNDPSTIEPWTVLDFGTWTPEAERDPKYGTDQTWAHVLYRKRCGHLVRERISFAEKVQTFDHYGTIFHGEHYSVTDWEHRIKWFQNQSLCEVCELSYHRWWIVRERLWGSCGDGRDPVMTLQDLLDYNYANWREFLFLGEDFPCGKVGPIWRPARPPKPNTYRRPDIPPDEKYYLQGAGCRGF